MERQFINSNFPYVRVVPVHNGIQWTVPRLCEQILTAYRAFDRPEEVLVWVDREGRQESAEFIRGEIINQLGGAGLNPQAAHVMVNDKMSENIILSDERVVKEEFAFEEYSYTHEGRNGKHILKEMYKFRGESYREMVHGVKLLKKVRLERCAPNSRSIQLFMQTFRADCWWIAA